MNHGQTDLGPYCLLFKVHNQKREQMTTVVNSRKRVNYRKNWGQISFFNTDTRLILCLLVMTFIVC